ncbi:MAG: hypothetical protein R3250_13055, partial [Melioribacteraceae bacterium]|nr:hypothetical protein [Melioribacteraceae bacterium]
MKKVTIAITLLFTLLLSNSTAQILPVITQPENQTVTEGETATFSVTQIGGLLPSTYQWQITLDQNPANFSNIPGATSSSYTTPATTLAL